MVATGLQDMALKLSRNMVKVIAAGGVDDKTIGTNVERIYQAIQAVYSEDGVLVLLDLGSALLSAQMAIEMFTPEQRTHINLSDVPLVEGTIAATAEAALGHTLQEINYAAESTREMQKVLRPPIC